MHYAILSRRFRAALLIYYLIYYGQRPPNQNFSFSFSPGSHQALPRFICALGDFRPQLWHASLEVACTHKGEAIHKQKGVASSDEESLAARDAEQDGTGEIARPRHTSRKADRRRGCQGQGR